MTTGRPLLTPWNTSADLGQIKRFLIDHPCNLPPGPKDTEFSTTLLGWLSRLDKHTISLPEGERYLIVVTLCLVALKPSFALIGTLPGTHSDSTWKTISSDTVSWCAVLLHCIPKLQRKYTATAAIFALSAVIRLLPPFFLIDDRCRSLFDEALKLANNTRAVSILVTAGV